MDRRGGRFACLHGFGWVAPLPPHRHAATGTDDARGLCAALATKQQDPVNTEVLLLGTRSPTLEQHQQVRDADDAIAADIDRVNILIPQQEDDDEIRLINHLVIAGEIRITPGFTRCRNEVAAVIRIEFVNLVWRISADNGIADVWDCILIGINSAALPAGSIAGNRAVGDGRVR